MNGVFIHDFLRAGELTQPIEYAKFYYSRYPAISLPYHPPLFPLFESAIFFGLGISVLSARVAVAIATALSVLLLYWLLMSSYRSRAIAAATTATFFALPVSQLLASDVMLEFPGLVFLIASLFFLRDIDRGLSFRNAIAFALLAGAAVWTKQNALFLGAVPFVLLLLRGRLHLLLSKSIWISALVFTGIVAVLAAISLSSPLAGNEKWPQASLLDIVRHNSWFYLRTAVVAFGIVPLLVITAALVLAVIRGMKWREPGASPDSLYVAWALSGFGLLLVLPPYDIRYMVYLYPALIAVGYSGVFRAGCRLLGEQRELAWMVPAGIASAVVAVNLNVPPNYIQGPAEAARTIVSPSTERVLYCGRTNGSFIFTIRSMDARPCTTIVLRGDKLPGEIFQPAQFEKFAHRFGITHVILEHIPKNWPWYELEKSPAPSMKLLREIPLISSNDDLNGSLLVFEFTNPSANPERSLSIPAMSGAKMDIAF